MSRSDRDRLVDVLEAGGAIAEHRRVRIAVCCTACRPLAADRRDRPPQLGCSRAADGELQLKLIQARAALSRYGVDVDRAVAGLHRVGQAFRLE